MTEVRIFWTLDYDDSRVMNLEVLDDTPETLTGYNRQQEVKYVIDKRALRRIQTVKPAS